MERQTTVNGDVDGDEPKGMRLVVWVVTYVSLMIALWLVPPYVLVEAMEVPYFTPGRTMPLLAWLLYLAVGTVRTPVSKDGALKAVAKLAVWPIVEWRSGEKMVKARD